MKLPPGQKKTPGLPGEGCLYPRPGDSIILCAMSMYIVFQLRSIKNITKRRISFPIHAITPSLFSSSISAAPTFKMSRRISSVCWPSSGGGVRMLGSEYEYLTGVLTIFNGPHVGWSIFVTMFLASTTFTPIHVRPIGTKRNTGCITTTTTTHLACDVGSPGCH